MYQRQLQRHLERSSAHSVRSTQSARLASRSASLGGSSAGSGGHLRRRSSVPHLGTLVEGQPAGAAPGGGAAGAQQPPAEVAEARSAAPPHPQQQQQQQLSDAWQASDGAAVETCPAALGATWLPTLMHQLGNGAGAGGASPAAQPQAPAAGPPPAGVAAGEGGQLRAPGSGHGKGSHRTLAEVRGLFADAAADGSASSGSRAAS